MYPKDIWECNIAAHLASPLPHFSSLFLLAEGQENQAANAAVPLSPNKLTSNGRGAARCSPKRVWFLQTKKLLSKVSAPDVPFICEFRVQAPAAVCPQLVFLSCICSVLKMVHDQSRRSELQSLPWVPKWPYCLCMHHVWGHFLREEEHCIQIKYLQELPPYLSCE